MKKLILTLGLGLCLTSVFAQSTEQERQAGTTTKSGQVILPQTGDIAIGIDASNVLNYLGNSLNGNTNNHYGSGIFNYEDNIFNAPSIYAKYFLSDNSAVRVKLHLGFDSYTQKSQVVDDAAVRADATSEAKLEDSYKNSLSGLGLRVGYEMRRGYGRLQGFYGAEVGLGFRGETDTYDYANGMYIDSAAPANNGATSTTWAGLGNSKTSRTTKKSSGSQFQGMVGGFLGVEYFVAPKLSIGGEFGLGLRFSSTGKSKTETESVKLNTTSGSYYIDNKEVEGAGGPNSFEFTTNYSGALTVAFHF